MKVRRLVRNDEFLKNIPDDLVEKLIHLKEPIPMRIHSMIINHIPNFNMRRNIAIGDDEKLVHKLREERFAARKLPALESGEYHNDLALQFIENHPEFAPIIKEIKYVEV